MQFQSMAINIFNSILRLEKFINKPFKISFDSLKSSQQLLQELRKELKVLLINNKLAQRQETTSKRAALLEIQKLVPLQVNKGLTVLLEILKLPLQEKIRKRLIKSHQLAYPKRIKKRSCSSTRNKQVKPGQKISEQTFLFMQGISEVLTVQQNMLKSVVPQLQAINNKLAVPLKTHNLVPFSSYSQKM